MKSAVRLDFDLTIKIGNQETVHHQYIEGDTEMELRTWLEDWKHSHPSSKVSNITVKSRSIEPEKKGDKNEKN